MEYIIETNSLIAKEYFGKISTQFVLAKMEGLAKSHAEAWLLFFS